MLLMCADLVGAKACCTAQLTEKLHKSVNLFALHVLDNVHLCIKFEIMRENSAVLIANCW